MSDYEIPNDNNVSPDDIQPEANLIYADLSGADLRDTNLEPNLKDADLLGESSKTPTCRRRTSWIPTCR